MIRKLYAFLFATVAVAGVATMVAPSVAAVDVFPACDNVADEDSAVCKSAGSDGDDATKIVGNIINALLWVIGVVSVIMIVIAGIKYTTSNGDANKIQSAKNTLLYAVIGLAVAILGQAIVTFVVARMTT